MVKYMNGLFFSPKRGSESLTKEMIYRVFEFQFTHLHYIYFVRRANIQHSAQHKYTFADYLK